MSVLFALVLAAISINIKPWWHRSRLGRFDAWVAWLRWRGPSRNSSQKCGFQPATMTRHAPVRTHAEPYPDGLAGVTGAPTQPNGWSIALISDW